MLWAASGGPFSCPSGQGVLNTWSCCTRVVAFTASSSYHVKDTESLLPVGLTRVQPPASAGLQPPNRLGSVASWAVAAWIWPWKTGEKMGAKSNGTRRAARKNTATVASCVSHQPKANTVEAWRQVAMLQHPHGHCRKLVHFTCHANLP